MKLLTPTGLPYFLFLLALIGAIYVGCEIYSASKYAGETIHRQDYSLDQGEQSCHSGGEN